MGDIQRATPTISMFARTEYDAATVAVRVLRLIFVASIFAFVLTVRTVAPIHASSGDPVDEAAPVQLEPSNDPAEEPPIDPLPVEPPPVDADPPPIDPVEPPPAEPPPPDTSGTVEPPIDPPADVEPPPADTVVEPAPTDPPPADPPPADTVEAEPPAEPPVEAEPPPVVEPTPTDPPADPIETVLPPPEPPVEELPPADPVEPAPTEPPVTDTLPPPLVDPSPVGGDPAGSDPSAAQPALSIPSTHPSAAPAPPGAGSQAQAATEPIVAIVSGETKDTESIELADRVAFAPAIAAGSLAAGIVITNHAPSSVAVAMEFGRAGGGWAGALVFNLWLRRQMRERRMSQRQLAALADVDHSTISRLLRQDRRPSLTTATKLARALKQVPGDGAEPEAADYFERIPEETVFPARRVELALRGDEMLNDEQVRRLMNIYLEARRRTQASALGRSARSRAAPARAAPDAG
jgi:transcriptional regulator with XRE-family HTH domain